MDDSACLTREIYIFSAYMEWVFWVGKYLFFKISNTYASPGKSIFFAFTRF